MEKKHFKNANNELFFEPSDGVITEFKLIAITKDEFDSILAESQKPTNEQIKLNARAVRDSFLNATDRMTLIDYSISDVTLTEEQRDKLIDVRERFKKWPSSSDFPNLEKLPDMPIWIFNESISMGWNAPKTYVPNELLELYELLN